MNRARSIFISGGGSGIGRAIALHFGGRGWLVGLGDIDESGMAATAALLPSDKCHTHRLDVRDAELWKGALADFAKAAEGRIDVVCNNAGIAWGGRLVDLSEEEVDQLVAVNLRGVLNGARAAWPYLRDSAPGSCLLHTSSAASLYGTAGMAVYSATKFAVRGLTEALDTEWRDAGIAVRSIVPSFIDTPLLAGPANAATNRTKRETVLAAGLGFTAVEDAAQAAWDAVHGDGIHTLVGKGARKLARFARWAPGLLRKRARALLDAGDARS